MRELFAISSGEDSDYSVRAVCEDEATAKAWADAIAAVKDGWHQDARVERMIFIPAGTAPYQVTEYSQNVELRDDGSIETRGIITKTDYPITALYGQPPYRPHVRYVRAPCHNNIGGRLEVRGSTEQSVAKVVGEKIAMWKAGAWGGPGHDEIIEAGEAAVFDPQFVHKCGSVFAFEIGQYVVLKAHVELYKLHEVMPLVVSERFLQECEGGVQRHYDCRGIITPSYSCSADETRGYNRFKEAELLPLDIAAYQASLKAKKPGSWDISTLKKTLTEASVIGK